MFAKIFRTGSRLGSGSIRTYVHTSTITMIAEHGVSHPILLTVREGGDGGGEGEIGYYLYKERPEKDSDSFLSGIERRTEVGWLVCVSHGPMWSEAGALVINSSKTKSTKGFRSGLYL